VEVTDPDSMITNISRLQFPPELDFVYKSVTGIDNADRTVEFSLPLHYIFRVLYQVKARLGMWPVWRMQQK
jgi:hypothetical protein